MRSYSLWWLQESGTLREIWGRLGIVLAICFVIAFVIKKIDLAHKDILDDINVFGLSFIVLFACIVLSCFGALIELILGV